MREFDNCDKSEAILAAILDFSYCGWVVHQISIRNGFPDIENIYLDTNLILLCQILRELC